MDLVLLVLGIAVVGFLVWLITSKVPMPDYFKIGIQVIAVILVVLFVIKQLGIHIPNFLN
jgi:hypothetical protein